MATSIPDAIAVIVSRLISFPLVASALHECLRRFRLDFGKAQPQRIGNDADGRERHRGGGDDRRQQQPEDRRSEEHTSELQSLMRISYAVFCLKKKTTIKHCTHNKR